MHKLALLFAAAFVLVVSPQAPADAQARRAQVSVTGGYCPAGTCASNGGPRAANVKNCKASNCPGAAASKTSKKR